MSVKTLAIAIVGVLIIVTAVKYFNLLETPEIAVGELGQPNVSTTLPLANATNASQGALPAVPATANLQEPNFSIIEDGLEYPVSFYVEETCGNNVCGEVENCATCAADCGCSAGQTCSSYGVCVENNYCGDGTCSQGELNCCSDCGCESGKVCNEDVNTCLLAATPTQTSINTVTTQFLARNNNSYTVGEITDYVYDDVPVKKVRMKCKDELVTGFENETYPCDVYLLIDSSGSVVEQLVPN